MKSKHLSRSLAHHLHHLGVALVVASVVTLMHHAHLLNWLDVSMLRIAGALELFDASGQSELEPGMPIVLLIDDSMHESEFGQKSPLDRRKLATLIKAIAQQCPARIGIDLDLSPGPDDVVAGDTTRVASSEMSALNEALIGAIRPEGCSSAIRIVLISPFPVLTSGLVEIKYDWMRMLCQRGVQFAFPEVFRAQGAVVQFDPSVPSLGAVMHGSAASDTPCATVADGNRASAVFLRKTAPAEHRFDLADFASQEPFNANFFRSEDLLRFVVKRLDSPPAELAGRSVFLGGSYDPADRFLTPFGNLEGVVLHAATYYSLNDRVRTEKRFGAFVLDVLIGVFAGMLFTRSWSGHAAAVRALGRAPAGRWIGPYLKARLGLVGNLLLVLAVIAMLVVAAAFLFHPFNIWVNPGPIVIGVCIKAFVASRDEHGADEGGSHATGHSALTHKPHAAALADWAIGMVLTLACVVMLSLHHS